MSTPHGAIPLTFRERPAQGEPRGALVLAHGRGADEGDLFPLFDVLDPDRGLACFAPRGPLSLPPGGAHWYLVRRVGFPDRQTFEPTFSAAAGWLDGLLEERGIPIERTVLGGFSQGAVMSYALGLGRGRPQPAGILALSGFIPEVDGFEVDLDDRSGLRVAIGHGSLDPVIGVDFGRAARRALEAAGAQVVYRESPLPHTIDPEFLGELSTWLRETIGLDAEGDPTS